MANYILLERIELNASAASVTFANIPQSGYTDLKIVASPRSDRSGGVWNGMSLTFNGSTSTYSSKILEGGDSVAASSNGGSSSFQMNSTGLLYASTFANNEIYIPNYTSSNFKSVSIDSVSEGNQSGGVYQTMVAGLWSTVSAITSITLTSLSTGNNFVQYSTFSLYGLAAVGTTPAIAPKASGGNRIDYDGTYWYHTFLASGTFTPQVGLTCDALVVAGGGGGGGQYMAGGGGAGGLRLLQSQSLATSTSYTVQVGAGGVGGTSSTAVAGSAGTNSYISGGTLSTITSSGGGGGASVNGATTGAATSGGSGGGAGANSVSTAGSGNAGSYSPVEGYAGGANSGSPSYLAAGGGGGAAGLGVTPNSAGTIGGDGGAGTNSYNSITFTSWLTATSSGVSGYLAGGGGGAAYVTATRGVGGTGGGGSGANQANANATNGTTNSGSGGGGTERFGTGVGGSGGSGIVIIRYLAA